MFISILANLLNDNNDNNNDIYRLFKCQMIATHQAQRHRRKLLHLPMP